MEEKLDLIILQNWFLLGILVVLWVFSVICNLHNIRRTKKLESDNELGKLWETDQVDELLKKSERVLKEYPNKVEARYLRGLALRKIGKYEEALHNFEKVKEIDPVLKNEAIINIKDIHEITANKSLNQDATDVAPIS